MPDGDRINFAAEIEAVARRLYGEPNRKLSSRTQLRFGGRGSLAIEIAGDAAGTWYDHETQVGGGTLDLIRHKLGLVNGEALEWLGAAETRQAAGGKRIVATYDYDDENGELLYQVVRYQPKDFRQRRPDGAGGWVWKLDGVRTVPYRLPSFAEADPMAIWIVEGEKDVEALRQLGLVASCNPMGAGKWLDEFAQYFHGWQVVILPDNDPAGRKHAQAIARNLAPVADSVRIIELPGLPPKGDVSDWLAAGGTAAELCDLVAAAELFDPAASGHNGHNQSTEARHMKRKRIGAGAILHTVYEPLRWIVPDYLPEGLSILAGRQKLGKTWLAIDFAIAAATGGAAMGGIGCEQGDALYIDMENGERRIKRRLETLFPYEPVRPDLSRLQFQFDASELGPELIAELDDWRESVEKPRLIVIDVLQRVKPAGKSSRNSYENDYSALSDLQRWATERGIGVLVLHHTRKASADDPLESLSGSNGLSACADTTLVLDRTAAGMTLYVRGRDVEELETALKFENGLFSILGAADEWKRSGERSAILRVLKDADEPMTPTEIAGAAGMKPNNVKRLMPKMTKTGEVQKVRRGRYVHPDRADLASAEKDDGNVVEFPGGYRSAGGILGNQGTGNEALVTAPLVTGNQGRSAEASVTADNQNTGNRGNHGNQFRKDEENQRSDSGASVTAPKDTGNQGDGGDHV